MQVKLPVFMGIFASAVIIAEILMGRRSVADWLERDAHYIRCIEKAEQSAQQVRRLFVEED